MGVQVGTDSAVNEAYRVVPQIFPVGEEPFSGCHCKFMYETALDDLQVLVLLYVVSPLVLHIQWPRCPLIRPRPSALLIRRCGSSS
jgi:hypothetical protein